MEHTTYFGDGEKTFALSNEMIIELERKSGAGIGAIYTRVLQAQFYSIDVFEIIRLGLIGGGTKPEAAQNLVDTYARPRPIFESYLLAFDILDARWNGKPEAAPIAPAVLAAAADGDMSAAINESLKESGL